MLMTFSSKHFFFKYLNMLLDFLVVQRIYRCDAVSMELKKVMYLNNRSFINVIMQVKFYKTLYRYMEIRCER